MILSDYEDGEMITDFNILYFNNTKAIGIPETWFHLNFYRGATQLNSLSKMGRIFIKPKGRLRLSSLIEMRIAPLSTPSPVELGIVGFR